MMSILCLFAALYTMRYYDDSLEVTEITHRSSIFPQGSTIDNS